MIKNNLIWNFKSTKLFSFTINKLETNFAKLFLNLNLTKAFSTAKIKQKEKHSQRRVRLKKEIKFTQTNPIVKQNQISPEIVREIDQQIEAIDNTPSIMKTNVLERMDAINYMKFLDSSFEGFFKKREFSLNNFNYYLQVLVRQNKINELPSVLEKMTEMGIIPDLESYNQLMVGYARDKNIKKCEETFMLIKSKGLTPNKYIYNSLLLAYAKNLKTHEADSIMREMRNEGILPDVVCYTTLIHAYRNSKLYEKCWSLYHEAMLNNVIDEFLLSYMIKLCGATHDAEKALKLYSTLEMKGFMLYTVHFNSILYALSSRREYAERTLEIFQKMKGLEIKPDLYTFVSILRATANLGDLQTANDVVKEIKLLNLEINEYICNGLLRTYVGAAKIPLVKEEHINTYLDDAWNIIKYMEKENINFSVQVINSLLELYCAAHKMEDVDGMVIPLFDKYGIQMNEFSFEFIGKLLLDVRRHEELKTLVKKAKKENITLTQGLLNAYLESGIRSNNTDMIVESLETLRENKRFAPPWLLRILSNFRELPDRVYVEMKNWPTYNLMARKIRTFKPAQIREADRTLPPNYRRKGKRIKR